MPSRRPTRCCARAPRRRPRAAPGDELRLAFVDHEDRQALRLFLRALRRLPDDVPWRATSSRPPAPRTGRAAQPAARPRRDPHGRGDDGGAGARRRRHRRRRVGRPGAGARGARARARRRSRARRRAAAGVRGGAARRRARAAVRARRRRDAGRSALPAADRRRAARAGSPRAVAATAPELAWSAVAERYEALYAARGGAPASAARRRRGARAAGGARADRRRPAHAHRPLQRLRHPGRRAARHRPRARASARSR